MNKKAKLAIRFRLSEQELKTHVPMLTLQAAYNVLAEHLRTVGFKEETTGLYIADAEINTVKAILLVQSIKNKLSWFRHAVEKSELWRIEETTNLNQLINA